MTPEAIPDLDGWEAYCEACGAFREARRAQECDAANGSEYFEFVCNTCPSILLTFQRLGTQAAESKPARPTALSRCPHCGELNVFPGFDQIMAYVCLHCGESVDATPPVQRGSARSQAVALPHLGSFPMFSGLLRGRTLAIGGRFWIRPGIGYSPVKINA